jgi:hypothetical protein
MEYFCPMINADCRGSDCVLIGDPWNDLCDLQNAYKSIMSIMRNIHIAAETLENVSEELCNVAGAINYFREMISECGKGVIIIKKEDSESTTHD